LEDRTVPTATWNNFGGNAQHTDIAQVAAQPIDQLLWQIPLDLAPWGYIHYGDPIFTPNNVVVVPIKVTWNGNNQGATDFIEVGLNDVTGAVLWSTAPMGSITGASNVGNTIVITTNNTNGLANGARVAIGDMQGDTAANTGSSNKTYVISNLTANSFTLNGVTGNGTYTGGGLWVFTTNASTNTSYIEPAYNWLPPDQAAYDPTTDRVYFPGPGGTIDYVSNPDTATGVVIPVQEAFYGLAKFTSNRSAYDASIYVNTPLTVDSQGNVYFGFAVTGTNPSTITKGGIVKITAGDVATGVSVFSAADTAGQNPSDDGNWVAGLGSAPAISNDGATVYFAVDDGGYGLSGAGESNAYLVGLNASNLQPEYSVRLFDPATGTGVPASGVQTNGNGAGVIDESSASPMVAPDGTVYMGIFGSNYDGSRGSLLHYSGDLQTEYTPGAFGWDDTASIIPTSMVPSYGGSSPYLILSKYNNYANAETGSQGGNGVNEIAVLDPFASQPDPNNDPQPNGQPMPVMKQVMAFSSPSPDIGNINGGDPEAVREWCTNGTAVDPAADSIFVNDEDGYTYEWNLGTDTITHTVEVSAGYGVPYTPTAISPNGEVFSDNGGMLFGLGGYSNYSITMVSAANPAVYGTPITLTTTLASTSGGTTPTGTITYTAYAGANNPLNYNTTPISLGTATIDASGVATLTLSGTQLLAGHYHVVASYSGESNLYSAGQTTIVLPVLETATTAVSASANPVTNGTSVTFTATVTPNGTPSTVVQNGTSSSSYFVPIGTVTFMDGSTVLGTVSLNSLNQGTYPSSYLQQVTLTTSSLPLGTDAITAVYSGDQNFAGGTSAVYNETVGGTTTTVQSSAAPSVFGQSVTFTATVTPLAGTNTPGGTVTFYDGTTPLNTATLSGGSATYTTSALAVGDHSITVGYSGDANDASSTSSPLNQTVNQDGTTTTLSTSAPYTKNHQSVTFTATVSHISPGAGTPTGTVTFMDGTSTLATVTLSGGKATFKTSALSVGIHSITASYSGNVNFATSSSSAVTQTVGGTTTVVTSTTNPTIYGQKATFTATVAAIVSGSGIPSGTVTFFDGSTELGTASVNGTTGQAIFTTSALALTSGSNAITASYSGAVNFATSTSAVYTQTVNPDNSTTTVAASVNPSVYGQKIVLTATVKSQAPGSGTPTGTVTFYDGSTNLGSGTLSSGKATITTTAFALSVGSNSITAQYGGDTNFNASNSTVLNVTVNQDATTSKVGSSAPTAVVGQKVTFTATITSNAPGSGVPTGTVTFYDGTTQIGTGTLNSSGKATLTISTLTLGGHSITARYGGDTNYQTSTSAAFTETINQAATKAVVTTSHNVIVFGQSVTFTAKVWAVSPGAGSPTGTVTFMDGTTTLGTGTLSGGQATFTTSALAVGTHSITAVYGGDTNFTTSTSASITETVNPAPTATTLISSQNPVAPNTPVTFTATVAPKAPGAGTPTGTVSFYDGTTLLGTVTLNGSGQATWTATWPTTGTHSIKAIYSGDDDFVTSTSAVLTQTVS
jgi:hypothetical protein